MGVGGNFWDLLKPYARYEGFDFLRNKRIAVDLSFWIVQQQTALQSSNVRNPHLRLTFFRTINLFSKFGAYPVFVVDGKPSPFKSKARIARFYRSSGIEPKDMPVVEEGVSVDRNKHFVECVEKCVELLKLLGMPVLRASGEAEALCAQLNSEGFVDACITADSDTFLFGAKCVIKHVDLKSMVPFECYFVEDIECGLGLRRKHLIAISLLVGSDHNLTGVQGIGMETALRFVKTFLEDEVLQRLNEISSGRMLLSVENFGSPGKCRRNSDKLSQKLKAPHCSLCGHPGNKTTHSRVPCEYCHSTTNVNCRRKPPGFKCECSGCDRDRKEREQKKDEEWHLRVCKKIATECNFPCNEIAEVYLANEDSDGFSARLLWTGPDIEMLIDFLAYHLGWGPSYVRQQIFPMLSTIYLRDMALYPCEILLQGQYKFDSIQRVKIRYGHESYVVRWRKSASSTSDVNYSVSFEEYPVESASEEIQVDESCNGLDELNVPQLHVGGGCSFISTDENFELVQAAFPAEVDSFLQQKKLKECNRRKSRASRTCIESESPNPGGVQLAITDYYRSSKPPNLVKDNHSISQNEGTGRLREKSKVSSTSLPKSFQGRPVSAEKLRTWRLILKDLSELLRCSKKTLELLLDAEYRVVTASRGDEALSTLRRKKRKVDLVVTRTKLPDMCAFRLVRILDTEFKIAVVMICDFKHGPTILRGLLSGAMFCLSNPLRTKEVENLWQHVIRNRRLLRESCRIFEAKLSKSLAESSKSSASCDSSQIRKRKSSDLEKVEGWVMGLPASFNWTNELHWKFLDGVVGSGVDVAVPSEVLHCIGSTGLIEYVNEKLQQYRLYLKGQQDLRFKRVLYNSYPSSMVAEQLMTQGFYTSPELTYPSEQRPPMTGFLQNPQDLLNATVFRRQADPPGVQEIPIPPMAFLGAIPASPLVLPDTLQLPAAPVPRGNYAQSSLQATYSSTVAEAPSVIIALPVPGRGQAEGEKDVRIRG